MNPVLSKTNLSLPSSVIHNSWKMQQAYHKCQVHSMGGGPGSKGTYILYGKTQKTTMNTHIRSLPVTNVSRSESRKKGTEWSRCGKNSI